MATAVSIRNIVKTFPSPEGGVSRAVDGVSLDIEPGELFFLLGPSGCGKTTLLRMIAGFIDPTAGQVLLNGRDITYLPPNQRNTGMVFQSYALWPHMTVEANVAYGLRVRKVAPAERATRALEALRAVHMEQYAARKPNQLSGGQQQRVALARAFVIKPDVLLLDEPLSNLDAKLRLELRQEIRRLCKASGITAIYVTHDQKEALSMADRIAIMRAGKLEQLGSPTDLYRRPASRFVAEFLGETNLLPGVVEDVSAAGVRVRTSVGSLLAAGVPGSARRPGEQVLCSIRPEALRVTASGGVLSARVHDTVYLGEQAQLLCTSAADPKITLRVTELNPLGRRTGDVSLAVESQDVALLAAE